MAQTTVLVIDAHRGWREAASEALRAEGYKVLEASGLVEAMAWAKEDLALVVVDPWESTEVTFDAPRYFQSAPVFMVTRTFKGDLNRQLAMMRDGFAGLWDKGSPQAITQSVLAEIGPPQRPIEVEMEPTELSSALDSMFGRSAGPQAATPAGGINLADALRPQEEPTNDFPAAAGEDTTGVRAAPEQPRAQAGAAQPEFAVSAPAGFVQQAAFAGDDDPTPVGGTAAVMMDAQDVDATPAQSVAAVAPAPAAAPALAPAPVQAEAEPDAAAAELTHSSAESAAAAAPQLSISADAEPAASRASAPTPAVMTPVPPPPPNAPANEPKLSATASAAPVPMPADPPAAQHGAAAVPQPLSVQPADAPLVATPTLDVSAQPTAPQIAAPTLDVSAQPTAPQIAAPTLDVSAQPTAPQPAAPSPDASPRDLYVPRLLDPKSIELEGSLAMHSILAILGHIAQTKFTGVLSITQVAPLDIAVTDGHLSGLRSLDSDFDIMAYMVESGLVDQRSAELVRKESALQQRPDLEIIAAAGICMGDSLVELQRAHLRWGLAKVLRGSGGSYVLKRDKALAMEPLIDASALLAELALEILDERIATAAIRGGADGALVRPADLPGGVDWDLRGESAAALKLWQSEPAGLALSEVRSSQTRARVAVALLAAGQAQFKRAS